MSVVTRARKVALAVVAGLGAALLVTTGPTGTASGATAAPNCGPNVLYKADGTRWRCTFADYFSGSSLDRSKWTVMTSAVSNYGEDRKDCFVNSPRNVAVGDGVLKLTSRRAAAMTCGREGKQYTATATSGMVSTYGKFNQTYGRFQMRARLPFSKEPGLQMSWWLWPKGANGELWPITGELDIAEWYSKHYDRVIPYLHYSTGFLTPSNATNNYCLVNNVGNWHIYTLVWTSQTIEILYDGKRCLKSSASGALGTGAYNKAFFMAFMQALGLGKNYPTAKTMMPAQTQVDWVRVWS